MTPDEIQAARGAPHPADIKDRLEGAIAVVGAECDMACENGEYWEGEAGRITAVEAFQIILDAVESLTALVGRPDELLDRYRVSALGLAEGTPVRDLDEVIAAHDTLRRDMAAAGEATRGGEHG